MTLMTDTVPEIPALTIDEVERLQVVTRHRIAGMRSAAFESAYLADVLHALRDLHATLASAAPVATPPDPLTLTDM